MLTLATAKHLAAVALEKADAIGKPITVCIVDVRGLVVYLERQDGAPEFTSTTAENKAVGSAFTGRPSAILAQMATTNPAGAVALSSRLGGRYSPAQGALPLVHNGRVVGAIGVAGASAEEDEHCARVAIDVVLGPG